jgi:hypothetical protein
MMAGDPVGRPYRGYEQRAGEEMERKDDGAGDRLVARMPLSLSLGKGEEKLVSVNKVHGSAR